MAWYSIVGLVIFLFLCVITSLLIMLVSNKSASMGLFGGGASQTPFASGKVDAMTRITSISVAAFFIIALTLSIVISIPSTITTAPTGIGTGAATQEQQQGGGSSSTPADSGSLPITTP